jgi:N-acetylneuraminic acid mutarotase
MKKGTRKFLISVIFLLLAFSIVIIPVFEVEKVNAIEDDSWTSLASLPTPFYSIIGAATVNGKIYFIGNNITAQYDPVTNTWKPIAHLPIYAMWADVVACQKKIYVIGGSEKIPTQVYDPATDTWENKTSIPTTRNGGLQANVVDNKIYVIGGQVPSPLGIINPSNATDVYDPATDSWSKMASIPTAVIGYASAVLNNKIYIIGGGTATAMVRNATNQVQIFDPKTNQWTNGTPIPIGVCYARACATTGVLAPKRIYVIGGTLKYNYQHTSPPATDMNQVYNPEAGNWSVASSMPTPRCSSTLVNVNDELYIIGGYDSSIVVSANEKYTPADFIPEFPSWVLLPLLLVATFVAIICKNRLNRNLSRHQNSFILGS